MIDYSLLVQTVSYCFHQLADIEVGVEASTDGFF